MNVSSFDINQRFKTCWVINNGVPAYRKQTCGVADAIGVHYIEKQCKLTKPWSLLPASLPFNATKHLTHDSDTLQPPWPDLIICSGRRTIALALYIKKANKGKTQLIYIQNPKVKLDEFSIIIAPEHDQLQRENVITTCGAMHNISQPQLEKEGQLFDEQFNQLKRPLIAVMLGGSSGNGKNKYELTAERTITLAQRLCELANTHEGSLVITPSRRTGDNNCEILRKQFAALPNIFFADLNNSNPYLAMLNQADTLLVTDDSVSMVSEACFTGKPVYVMTLPEYKAKKKRNYQFIQQAIERGMVRPFNGTIEQWTYPRLDEMTRIAPLIKEKLRIT